MPAPRRRGRVSKKDRNEHFGGSGKTETATALDSKDQERHLRVLADATERVENGFALPVYLATAMDKFERDQDKGRMELAVFNEVCAVAKCGNPLVKVQSRRGKAPAFDVVAKRFGITPRKVERIYDKLNRQNSTL